MRVDWPHTILGIARCLAKRSKDRGTQVGAVIVSNEWMLLGSGYNGFPRKAPDELLPKSGPAKHLWTIHAEENAVLAALSAGWASGMQNAKCVSTHRPCARCLRLLYHVGVYVVLYGVDELSPEQTQDAERVELVLGMKVEKVKAGK